MGTNCGHEEYRIYLSAHLSPISHWSKFATYFQNVLVDYYRQSLEEPLGKVFNLVSEVVGAPYSLWVWSSTEAAKPMWFLP